MTALDQRKWCIPNYMADEAELPKGEDYNLRVAWKSVSWRIEKHPDCEDSPATSAVKTVDFHHFVQDETTGAQYLDETKGMLRYKLAVLIMPSFLLHFFGVLSMMAIDAVAFVTTGCRVMINTCNRNRTGRIVSTTQCLTRFANFWIKPLQWVGIVTTSVCGVVFPLSCRKLYASIERDVYWRPVLAPCFQPLSKKGNTYKKIPADCRKCEEDLGPISHLFAGEVNQPGIW